jgi:hypothetical protein
MHSPKYLNRKEASEHLRSSWGLQAHPPILRSSRLSVLARRFTRQTAALSILLKTSTRGRRRSSVRDLLPHPKQKLEAIMIKVSRQKSGNVPTTTTLLDFGAAAALSRGRS